MRKILSLLSFTGIYWDLLGFTGIYRILHMYVYGTHQHVYIQYMVIPYYACDSAVFFYILVLCIF